MVNKIPTELENPIDVILYNQVDKDLDFYKKLGLTPNGLTTISLVLSLLSIYNFHYDNYFLAALLFFIGYYFDCADGKMARKYNMISEFGDLYDHISDTIKILVLFFIIYKKSFDKFLKILIVSILLLILFLNFIICQNTIQQKINKNFVKYNFIDNFNIIGSDNCEEKIKYLKYFGSGTLMTYFSICILFWDKI